MSARHEHAEHRADRTEPACHGGSPATIIVLVALGSLILSKWRDGALPLYVHPDYATFLAFTGVATLGLAGVQLWSLGRRGFAEGRDAPRGSGFTWSLGLVTVAVLAGAVLPAQPLGSTAAANQSTAAPAPSLHPLTDETEGWTLLEWAQAVGGGLQRERLVGRPVSVVGFVYRPREGPAAGETRVARFVVRCCAADGFAVSLPIRSVVADALQPDTWIQVDGVLRLDESGSRPMPYVDADRINVVPAPAAPYLVPT